MKTAAPTLVIGTAVAISGALMRWFVLGYMAEHNKRKLWDTLMAWDSQHYLRIARQGYVSEDSYAFFPALPTLMKLGPNPAVMGIIVSVVSTAFMAAAVMALARRMGAGLRGQSAAAVVVSMAPMSMVFIMPYTEALFGALAFWALVALYDRRWVRAGVLVFLLGFVRLTSVDVLLIFGLWVLLFGRREFTAWLSLLLSSVPVLSYLYWAGTHLKEGYFGLQKKNWHSYFDFGKATVKWVRETLTSATDVGYLLTTLSILCVIVAVVMSWRQVPWVVWAFTVVLTANVLLSDGVMHSRPRLLLPVAIALMPWAARAASSKRGWGVIAAWAFFGTWFGAYMLTVFKWAI